MNTNKAFAEVIESSLYGWLAQSWKWDHFPSFGSLVSVTQGKRIYVGVVYQVKTGSADPTRTPFAYQKTEQELLKEQPQIFEFLKTTFSCLFLGYQENDYFFYIVAPEPTKIHTFIEPVPHHIYQKFFENSDYLHLLFGFSHHVDNLDELLLALLSHAAQIALLTRVRLENFIKTYALLVGNDYRRTRLFLQRVQQSIVPL